MTKFYYKGDKFYLGEKPYQVRSGAIHYFRVPSYYWYDRLLKLKECGLNTVETYVAWNVHEENEGKFCFSEEKDLGKFIDIASDLGLKVIVRPGPLICAEWEFGGLPAWLLRYPNIKFRCNNEVFLEKVEHYIERVAEIVVPRLTINGGNVIMVQVENEYGSFGNDKIYLKKLVEIYKKYSLDGALLFTSDGTEPIMLDAGGYPEECLITGNFGSAVEERMGKMKDFIGDKPLMCTEFWCGWFYHWYGKEYSRPVETVTTEIDAFLRNGWNFNMYMFHGGTNFGFMNGANAEIMENDKYCPTITSYDYGAPLNEAGDRTELYYKIKEVIEKYTGEKILPTATESKKTAYGKVKFTKMASLFDNLENIGTTFNSTTPLYMEDCGQNYGYILYSNTLGKYIRNTELRFLDMKDRANIFIDGQKIAVVERSQEEKTLYVTTGENTAKLDILVENMGRINYGARIHEKKGISGVRVWEQQPFNWTITNLPMNDLSKLKFTKINQEKMQLPAFYKATFKVEELGDTFVKPYGFNKGFIVVNGHNLGRYYNQAGPQKTLYCPECFLKKGENEIIIFESDGISDLGLEFVSSAEIG